ncbi:MAG: YncE family protein [Terriglobales bacterium]
MKRFLWLGLVFCLYSISIGCGDTFRPIIIPNPPVFPNPAAAHTVVSINDNGTIVSGSAMVIDVSGDTDVSVADVGLAPVHAVQQTASAVLVVNHSVTGAVSDSITRLNFSGTTIGGTNTIGLPANSAPDFVAVAPSATTAYVTLPNYAPPSVGVINTLSNNLTTIIPVGNQPDAIAVTPDDKKLYVANHGDNTVNGFNTVDLSPRTINGSFSAPLWAIARSDSQRLYVLNGNGVVSTLDVTSGTGPDSVIDASINAPGAAYMLYDGNKNRLYIPGGAQLTILDVSQSIPQPLGASPITIPTVPPSSRSTLNDPCSSTAAQPLTVAAVAALPDGSRAYVGAYYEDTSGNFCPQVTVIDAMSNTIKTSIAIPGFAAYDAFCSPQSSRPPRFRITMAAGGDSTRAYLASCDGGMVNIIDTSDDAYLLNLPAPLSTRSGTPLNPPQNPVFLFAGP